MALVIEDLSPAFERALQGYYYGTPSRAISYYPKLIYHWIEDHPRGFEAILSLPEGTVKSMLGLWLSKHGLNGSWTTRPENFRRRPFLLMRTDLRMGYIETPVRIVPPRRV